MDTELWDVFISHAWEDKEAVARPLAEMLKEHGLRVWYDEFTLTLGDSLRRSIDQGLAQSRYGIVILSHSFFLKEWPQRELDGLAAREINSPKVILPVWHGIDRNDIVHYSPVLADRMAVSTSRGLTTVAKEVLRVTGSGATTLGDVTIVPSTPGAARHILIDPSLEHQWKAPNREIIVFSVGRSTAYSKSREHSKLVASGAIICTPDFFFSDNLIYDRFPSDAFPGCVPVRLNGDPKKRNIVLPLSPEVLKLFTPQTLADNFIVDWQLDGAVVCRLKMLLHSSLGNRPCIVQRTFREESFICIENLPLISIWPDFRLQAGWHLYFVFQLWAGDRDELSVRPWSAADRMPSSTRRLNINKQRFQICQTSSYPEALICETPYDNKDGHGERNASGLLLLKLPDVVTPSEHPPVKLGIQFGPTSSSVFQSAQGRKPKPVLFKNRVREVTDYDVGMFRNICRDLFVPAVEWPAEVVHNFFHDFGDPPRGEDARLMLRDGHILYLDDPRRFVTLYDQHRHVKSNFMWGSERERRIAKDFLTQLCLQAIAELAVQGVRKVDLCFSYPTEFAEPDIHRLTGIWNSIAGEISKFSDVTLTVNADKIDNREVVTATRFFASTSDDPITGTTVVILISSITTCLAVWNNLELRAHNSIMFADRDILLTPLHSNPGILNEIDPSFNLDIQNQRDAKYRAYLDATVTRFGLNLISALPVRQARPHVQGLLHLLEIGLCGIGFYAGLMVRRLIENKSIDKNDITRISIFVGGKGSKIFNWCALGISVEESEFNDSFSRAVLAGANWPNLPIHIRLSSQPSGDVACGLVSPQLNLRSLQSSSSPMAGEVFEAGKNNARKRSWTDFPTWAEIQALSVTVDRSLPIFQQFLRCIGSAIEPQDVERIGGFIDLQFAHASAIEEDLPLQRDDLISRGPIFAMALKRFLQLEIEKWRLL